MILKIYSNNIDLINLKIYIDSKYKKNSKCGKLSYK